jgi:hypothetical protein
MSGEVPVGWWWHVLSRTNAAHAAAASDANSRGRRVSVGSGNVGSQARQTPSWWMQRDCVRPNTRWSVARPQRWGTV